MKTKLTIFIFMVGCIFQSFAQSTKGSVVGANQRNNNNQFLGWDNTGTAGSLDIRNDFNNQPIDFFSDNVQRMRINSGTATFSGMGGSAPTPGFVGIGVSPTDIRSRLTITGENNAGAIGGGFRTWMKTGVFCLENSDNMYVGMKDEDSTDRSDATIVWSDNSATSFGIDKLRFIFTGSADIGGNNSDPRSVASTNGYEFMQMTPFPSIPNSAGSPVGHVGIGPLFNGNANLPQNRLHINAEDNLATFLQISNELGTGQTANDGLRIGYPTTSGTNREARIEQQENDRLTFFTNTPNGGGERIRITQTNNIWNNANAPIPFTTNNLTRIGISHNPTTPVTRPLSLLHLGYNVANATSNDGWREWMDVGMFVSQNSDNVYLGMKPEEGNGSDAVLAWGDNSSPNDNFKIVFTTPEGGLPIPSASPDGVEALRMTPTLVQGIFTGIGGDPAANPYFGSSPNPTAALEVNAWGAVNGTSGLRFTDLNSAATPVANPGAGVLSVNASGDVIYVPANNAPSIGNYCGSTPNPLADHFEIPLDGFTYNFRAGTNDYSTVNIGNVPACGLQFPARLYVRESDPMTGSPFHTAIAGLTEGNNLPVAMPSYGVMGLISQAKTYFHAGVYGASTNADNDIWTPNTLGIGIWGTAMNNDNNIGVYAITEEDNANLNVGVWGKAVNGEVNHGVYGEAKGGTENYAIYGEVDSNGTGINYAGYFNGDVLSTTGNYLTSDTKLKSNIKDLSNDNALTLLNKLIPKSYEYRTTDYPSMNLPKGNQYGLIAQDVEAVLPQLVKDAIHPAARDTQGNIIHPQVAYKAVNYTGFIPILIAAMQNQQEQLEAKDSLITNLNKRLTQLEQCVSNANLCGNLGGNNFKKEQNEESPVYSQNIELKNLQTIILDQNVPNPFAEQTVIGYYLPDEVKSAEIIFHNAQGRQINRAEIATRGKGEINVYAQDLSSGVYTYTLIADGNVIDTKRMVKK